MKKKILLATIVIAILLLVYWVIIRHIQNLTIENSFFNTTPPTPSPTPIEIDDEEGCSTSFPTACSPMDMNEPLANMGCCGESVINLQTELSTTYNQGINVDGKYGEVTAQAHQNMLDGMGGTYNQSITSTFDSEL